MKKLLALVMMAALFVGLTSAYALPAKTDTTTPENIQAKMWAAADAAQAAKVEAAKEYAYMDPETAPATLRKKILEARNTIIYSKSWVADGLEGFIGRADGTIEKLPQFSELFPGWDIPVIDATEDADSSLSASSDLNTLSPMSADPSRNFHVYFNKPPAGTNTIPFYSFYHTGTYVKTRVGSLTSSQHCNLGYTDTSTGASLSWAEYLYPVDFLWMPTLKLSPLYFGIRASTHSNPGYGMLIVTYDNAVPTVSYS